MNIYEIYSKYKNTIRATMFFIGLSFIFLLLKESWDEVSILVQNLNVTMFVASLLIGIIGNFIIAIFFKCLLYKYGFEITTLLALKLYIIGQVAKYIPGKIWGIVFQLSYIKNMSNSISITLANIELMFGVLFISTVLSIFLICLSYSSLLSILLFFSSMLVFIYFYNSSLINNLTIYFTKKIKFINNDINAVRSFDGAIFYILFLLIYLISNTLMLQSVFSFSVEESILYIALLSISWVGAVLAFFVPAGIGVRELLFIFISNYMIPGQSIEMLASIAIICRFWQMLQEIIGGLFILFLKNR